MAIALIAHVSANSAGNASVTSSAIDTTGATLLVANLSYYNLAATAQLTDFYNNTWTPLPLQFQTDASGRLFYCANPTVGTGHTFTLTNGAYSAVAVAAFSGVNQLAPLDVSSGAPGTSASATGGSVTPTNANSLVISGCAARNTGNITGVGGGFTITDNVSTGAVIDSALAYLIQTAATAANPAWALSGSLNWGVTNAVFIAGSATVPASPALVASIDAEGTGTFTSAAIDTTGATILIVNQSGFNSLGTISDSKGNTWTPLTLRTNGSTLQRLYYAVNPTVGSGHTFTVTSGSSGSMQVGAFSGVAIASPLDVEAGTTGTGDAQAGSVTPAAAGSLVITGLGYTNSGQEVVGIDLGFKIAQLDPVSGPPGSVIGGALAWLAQGAAAALNPKWYFSASGLTWAADNAVFKTAATAATVTAVAATASALMPAPVVTAAATIQAVAMKATAAMPAPAVTGAATVQAIAATATAAMIAPTVGVTVSVAAPPMTSTARMIAPVVTAGASVQGIALAATAAMGVPSVSAGMAATPGVFRPSTELGTPGAFRTNSTIGEPGVFREDSSSGAPEIFKPGN
jgi:hypothetical protein